MLKASGSTEVSTSTSMSYLNERAKTNWKPMSGMANSPVGLERRWELQRLTARSLQRIDKSKKESPPFATDRNPNPGDFPIGSVASRAAARALLVQRESQDRPCAACFLAGLGTLDGGNPNDRKFLNNPHMEWRDGWWHYRRLTPEEHVRLLGFVGCGLKVGVHSNFSMEEGSRDIGHGHT
jgi:hypothetical protein